MKLIVKKKSGRVEPFDSGKMARAVSRSGVPFAVAQEITRSVKGNDALAGKSQISSVTLRRMVADELRARNRDTVAKSYLGYKKTGSVKEKVERSRRHAAKVRKSTKTHSKRAVREKDIRSGRPPSG